MVFDLRSQLVPMAKPPQRKAYRLADNKTGELADWDDAQLVQELTDLQNMDFDVDLLGFSADELHDLFQAELQPGQTDPDAIPEPPDVPTSNPGDLWILGQHRLLCGDAGRAEDIDRLLGGAPVHLVHSDPPYNVRVEPRSNNAIAAGLSSFPAHAGLDTGRGHPEKATTAKLRAKDRPLANDFLAKEEFNRLLHAWFGNMARVLQPARGLLLVLSYGVLLAIA
jgi:hypothetical protein